MSKRRVLSEEEFTQYQRWNLPRIGEHAAPEVAPEEELTEELKPITAEELEQIQQQAYQEGFKQGQEAGFSTGKEEGYAVGVAEGQVKGLEQGIETGLEQGKEQIDATIGYLKDIIATFTQPLQEIDHRVHDELLALAVSITEKVILQHIEAHPENILVLVQESIQQLPVNQRKGIIYLHPDDMAIVQEHLTLSENWQCVEDVQLQRGGCRIETEFSSIDMRLEKRFQEAIKWLL